jgi:hypothetical protein
VHTLAAGLVFLLAVSSGICQPCRKHFQVGGQYRSCHKKFTKPEGPDFQATDAKFLSQRGVSGLLQHYLPRADLIQQAAIWSGLNPGTLTRR